MSDIIKVKTTELPLSCPNNDMDLAMTHPRVVIDLKTSQEVIACPYCGTCYQLDDGD